MYNLSDKAKIVSRLLGCVFEQLAYLPKKYWISEQFGYERVYEMAD
jgi:hypothetical protein